MGLTIYSLWHREVLRFVLDRSRVFSSLGQPIIFWLMFAGALSQSSFRPGAQSYGEYFLVGGLAMTLLFTAIFSTITVIEDRKEGFLQSVLVSPAPRSAIALGKIAGCSTLAMLNGLLFFALLPILGVDVSLVSFFSTAGIMLILAVAMTGMGYSLAWVMESSAGYHGIMMVLFMPMLLLSGAFFPLQGAHWAMSWLMTINPLTYGVGAMRYSIYGSGTAVTEGLPAMWTCFGVTAGFAVAMFVLGAWITLRKTARVAQ